MPSLRDRLPERSLDPSLRARTYIGRRRGARDEAQERRRLRAIERAARGGGGGAAAQTIDELPSDPAELELGGLYRIPGGVGAADRIVVATTLPDGTPGVVAIYDPAAPQHGWRFQDDFFNIRGWDIAGAGTVKTSIAGSVDHPGRAVLETAATNATQEILFLGGTFTDKPLRNVNYDIIWIAYAGFTLTNVSHRIGLSGDWSADPPTAGAYFEYDSRQSDTTWHAITRSGVNETDTNMGVTVDNVYARFRIRKVGGAIYFTINDGADVVHTTHVADDAANPGVQVRTYSNQVRDLGVDYFSLLVSSLDR